MKKTITLFLLGLLVTALTGCNKTGTDPTATPAPTVSGVVTDESATPTPILPTPTPEGNYVGFSLDSGFYEKTQKVSLSCNVEGALIYYTLDGSTPNKTSTLYKNEITVSRKLYTQNVLAAQKDISVSNNYIPDFPVDKCTVIRAIAYLPDGTTTPVAHASYFVGLDRDKYGDVPIISLITDFDNLYDYETGIYVLGKTHDEWLAEDPSRAYLDGWQHTGNYSNRGREWEREISVELITADGTPGFKQNMGVRIMGGASRNQPQKSLKLYAREEYGAKNLKYELIPDNYNTAGELIDKYKTFVLRVGGNDADFARLRDPFLQTMVKDARFETQQSTPCIAFLNGEYWGMYTLNEDYTDNHFENNYGIDNNNIVLIKRGELEEGNEDDMTLYHDMFLFITQNDMSDPVMYEGTCDLIDIGSFADYFAFQLYIYNEDGIFQDNNWRMWRVRNTDMATEYSDGRWRFAAYDND
ncbi:MAG: CotH kinase family protein, partial [Lachnospiraceae bacterium]|nr:CotH kinase family protein [Lachnospiraceae bacterium]